MTLVSKQDIDFNNSKATLIDVTQPANGIIYLKQILIFEDSTRTVLVNGIYPQASKSVDTKIKEALLSTVYDPSQNENPLEAATFNIDIENTEFKLVKYASAQHRVTQDDYTTLGYKIPEHIDYTNMSKRGYCVVTIDPDGRANKVRFQKDRKPLHEGEYLIEYTASDRRHIHIGAESCFSGKAMRSDMNARNTEL